MRGKELVPVLGAVQVAAFSQSGTGFSVAAIGLPAVSIGLGLGLGLGLAVWWAVERERSSR